MKASACPEGLSCKSHYAGVISSVVLCCVRRDALLTEADAEGAAWVVCVERQYNAAVVISRGAFCGADRETALAASAQSVAEQAGFRFDAASRASHRLLWL